MAPDIRWLLAAILLCTAGCETSSHVLVGKQRPPIAPESVQVYLQPPANYEEIATVNASSQGSFAVTSQQNTDLAIQRLKEEAAKLGANGILLQGMHDTQSGSIGLGAGGTNYGPGSSTSAGAGGSFALTSKVAQGIAIYVPPPPQ